MLRCLMDTSVPQDSKCSKCCIYCDDKETCEYVCKMVEEGKGENDIATECILAYEE